MNVFCNVLSCPEVQETGGWKGRHFVLFVPRGLVECRSSQFARDYLRVSRGLQSRFRVSEAPLLPFRDFWRKPGYR